MRRTIITLSTLTFLLYACKEEDVITTPELNSTQACRDHLIAESIFNDVEHIINKAFTDNGQNKTCPDYSLMNANELDSDTLIINFGNTNCLYSNKLRRGIINITYTGKYHDSLSVITSTFDNYYVNNNLVQGEMIRKNNGTNNLGNIWLEIDVNNASITTPLNGTINWKLNIEKEWIKGQETYSYISDDQYKITGTASGNSVNGNTFTMKITDPINIDLSCLISCVTKSGTSQISPNGYADRIINYGDSLCDCNVDVMIDGNNYPIVIGN